MSSGPCAAWVKVLASWRPGSPAAVIRAIVSSSSRSASCRVVAAPLHSIHGAGCSVPAPRREKNLGTDCGGKLPLASALSLRLAGLASSAPSCRVLSIGGAAAMSMSTGCQLGADGDHLRFAVIGGQRHPWKAVRNPAAGVAQSDKNLARKDMMSETIPCTLRVAAVA